MSRNHLRFSLIHAILTLIILQTAHANSPTHKQAPQLPLAYTYKQGTNLNDYWLSEKLDGVRAYWNGKQLISKQGNVYHAPDWFTVDFPAQPLDGELWIARNSFEQLIAIVSDDKPGTDWREVRYMVFDMPLPDVIFTKRIEKLKTLFASTHSPYLRLVEQSRIPDHKTLTKQLNDIVNAGGEGLMLHRGGSYYQAGRSNDLLKVKTYQDAEARVIAHLPGKGKFKGMLGALLVETNEKIRFRLGTGFTDQERREPPPIDSLVTYKYYGETANGVPRFASYLRIRKE